MFDVVLKSVRHTIARSGVWLTLCTFGCGARVDGQPQESNTNWLKACDDDAQCGEELACECGVCTKVCDTTSCPSRLTCLAQSACAPNTGASCQATCDDDDDCTALAPNMQCDEGVCVDDVGLTLNQVSSSVNPGVSVSPTTDGETTCRLAYVEYPVGSRVSQNGCGDSCVCGNDGEWTDCDSFDDTCPQTSEVRACSEMFPGIALDELPSDPLTVEAASITGTNLTVTVSYAGGCKTHDHALCFAPGGESYPVFVNLELIHDSHGDACEAGVTTELQFDLTAVANDYAAAYQSSGDIIKTPFGLFGFGELTCEMRETASSLELADVRLSEDSACVVDDDCLIADNSTGCHAACGVVTSHTMAEILSAKIDAINSNFCNVYEEQCGPVIIPPCAPPGKPVCLEGQCVEMQ